jgi:hypothetical protein
MHHPTLAIVATVRNPGPSFKTWIAYHLHQADHPYIFLDKPGTGDEQLNPANPRVTGLAGEQLSWMTGQKVVMQRQSANVWRALGLCRKEGFTWLLHIDADELIWSPQASIRSYFPGVAAEVSQVSFVNHEVVNQFDAADDYFSACVLRYPCVSYSEWLKKHSYLGDVLPYWRANPQVPIEFPFLLDSRDA